MRSIVTKQQSTRSDYDKIYQYFDGGSIRDICYRIWKFCKDKLDYKMEDGEQQNVSGPYTILTGGKVDCKNYALFISGILDAMKRHGKRLTWQFRFASYELFELDPGHVFVVVNPNTDDIWIDPVLDEFDEHLFYWHHRNRNPKPARVAGIGWISARVGSAESDLLATLKEYTDGLVEAVQVSQQNNTINTITEGVLLGAAVAVPVIGAAVALLKLGAVALSDAFGVGSAAARAVSDLSSGRFAAFVNDLFNGRTYNTDQYWAAALYQNKVQGKNITNQDQTKDSDVLPALKWFIDRTGVFISGREHIIALTQSPQAYMALASVNSDTTTDPARVQAAYEVASTYWKNPASYDASGIGSWANTIGVYDTGLAGIANQYGVTPETYEAQTGYQGIQQQAAAETAVATEIIPGVDNLYLYLGFGALFVLGLFQKK